MAAKKKTSVKKTRSTKKKTGAKKKKTGAKKKTSARKKKGSTKKYGAKAQKKVGRALHEQKRGALKSGRSGRKVKSRKQAIAIGLSEARASGTKVPPKKKGARKKKSR